MHATLLAAAGSSVGVLALHVHHGLTPQADQWLLHCEQQCARWARRGLPVGFVAQRVNGRPAPGDSVEAWARKARYAALRQMASARDCGVVLLGHHQRDQAETLVLQALRGAGVAGLSAMPVRVDRGGITWLRPWLARPREHIVAYVRRHRLRYIDDASNGDARFARNRLRMAVWPALTTAFPQAEASLATAAGWAQQAGDALDELAAIDLASVQQGEAMNIEAWRRLSTARRSNLLRAWLKARLGQSAPASLIERLCDELPDSRNGVRWPAPGAEVRRERGLLLVAPLRLVPTESAPCEIRVSIRRAGSHALPGWPGRLDVRRVPEGGVPLAWLGHLDVRPRAGAEQFQAGLGRPPRSLKKQYQAAGVPAEERDGPLLFSGGQLVFVAGLGLDARMLALPGQAQVSLRWLPLRSVGPDPPGDDGAQS